MATNILFEVTVLNGSIPITLRMASAAATPAGCQMNSFAWTPLITKRHTTSGSWNNDGIFSQGEVNHSSLTFRMSSAYENEVWSSYEWTGGLARIFVQTGAEGDFASYRQVFEGSVSSLDREGVNATVGLLGPDALLDRDLLTLEYQGTGVSEGPPDLKGTLKPLALGSCLSVEPVQVDPAKLIYQVHGYGAVESIRVYEYAQELGAGKNKGDVADYAALAGLALLPGEWATCTPQGMFRLGGTPSQKISADVIGIDASTVSGLVRQLLTQAGIPSARQGSSLDFSTATWNLYQREQVTIGEVARALVAQAGGQLFADGTGTWQVLDFFTSKTPIVLNADRSTVPLVKSVKETFAPPPVWKVKVGNRRVWSVHSSSEVSPALSEIGDKAQASKDAAAAASEAAALAAEDARVAKDRVDAIASDGILDRSEKAGLVLDFGNATAERTGLLNKGSEFVVTAERTAYSNAYNALKGYTEGLSPAYTDTTQNTVIDRSAFNNAWGGYHIARQNLLNAIDGKAGTIATWTGVTGTGKPANNATVGAPAGTNVAGTEAAALVNTATTANTNATTALNASKDKDGIVVNVQAIIDSVSGETTRAKDEVAAAKVVLNADIVAAKAEGTKAQTDLASEVTRAKADTASIRTDIVNINQTAGGNTTAIRDEAVARANADGALATRSSRLESITRTAPTLAVDGASGLDAWTANRPGSPDTMPALATFGAAIVMDADLGTSVEWSPSSSGSNIGPRDVIRVLAGRIYEVRARVKVQTLSTDGTVQLNLWLQWMDTAFANVGSTTTAPNSVVSAAGQIADFVFTVSNTTSTGAQIAWPAGTSFLRPLARLGSAETSLVLRTGSINVTDVTDRLGTNARITSQGTTLTNADSALAIRASAVETTLNTPTTGVVARLGTEETVRANADSAIVIRTNALETTLNTPTTGVTARLTAEETVRASADAAIVGRTVSLEARSTGGGNLIANTDFVSSSGNVIADGWTPTQAIPTTPTFGINLAGDSWHPSNENAISIFQVGQAGVANYTGWQSPRFAVQPGTYLNAYCYMASHRCQTQLILYWTDVAGTILSASSSDIGGGTGAEMNGGTNLAGWRQQGFSAVQVPTNALGAFFELRKYNTNSGQSDSYAWFVRPFASVSRLGVTEFAPFAPGSLKQNAMATTARLGAEETARTTADSAMAIRATNLETTVNNPTTGVAALQVRIGTEESTRATAVSAIGLRTSVVEAQVSNDASNLLRNGTFNASDTNWKFDQAVHYPKAWLPWSQDGNAYIGPHSGANSKYGAAWPLQIDRAGDNNGVTQSFGAQAAGWYVIEVDVTGEDGAWNGSGVFVQMNNGSSRKLHFGTEADTAGVILGGTGSMNRKFSTMFFNGEVSNNAMIYLMAGWTQFTGSGGYGFLRTIWHKIIFRPASDAEIKAQKVIDANVIARVASSEGAIVGLNSKTTAWSEKTVSVPGAEAAIRMMATNSAGQPTANIALMAPQIALLNLVNNQPIVALRAEGGDIYIAGDLRGGAGRIIFDNGTVMKVSGTGFGSNNQFVEWFGPRMALNQCTELNAKWYLKTNGDTYFGGALQAGSLRNSSATSSFDPNAGTTTGQFGSNGGTITVVGSWAWARNNPTVNYPATTAGLNSFNADKATYGATGNGYQYSSTGFIDTENSNLLIRKGADLVASIGIAKMYREWHGTAPVVNDSPGVSNLRLSASQSITWVDPERSTNPRVMSAAIQRAGSLNAPSSQTVSINTVET